MTTNKTTIVAPLIHMNGTSAANLTDDLETAYSAIRAAIEALKQGAPNQRDYYPLPPDRWEAARAQHYRRLQTLTDLQDELIAQCEMIHDQARKD